ncbi:hypothetical protein Pyn_18892 [Prunus yedoensis var. nudiflora]|uniref:Uncharacterized protein n=1 Tax=Prunus yedoensis var. nudiflora TaxID=2094558 RepID=A0A314Z2W2_PRUYE|nr:hypothetical protein Pyn_18892 [Prunus yedoensis var. nudiflora]
MKRSPYQIGGVQTASNGSTFRNDREDDNVVEQMYQAADQMGEDMPIGLGGSFEYQGVGGAERGEVGTTDQGGGDIIE